MTNWGMISSELLVLTSLHSAQLSQMTLLNHGTSLKAIVVLETICL